MNDKNNIIKQAKHDIYMALQGTLKAYNMKGVSYSALKKYYKKKGNFKDLLEDIKNKGIHLFDNESDYKKTVKEVLMDILDDKIAYEKDKKNEHIKTFEKFDKDKVEHCKRCNDILIYKDGIQKCNNCGAIHRKNVKFRNVADVQKWFKEQK